MFWGDYLQMSTTFRGAGILQNANESLLWVQGEEITELITTFQATVLFSNSFPFYSPALPGLGKTLAVQGSEIILDMG